MRTIFLLLFSFSAFAQNVLVIGDSHMAGLFGKELFKNLSKEGQNIVVLGHASSAAIQWTGERTAPLSGGVFNQAIINGRLLMNPRPTHWREKVKTPLLAPLLENMLYHPEWKRGQSSYAPDTVVIELGANDAKAIADFEGNIFERNYLHRREKMDELISLVVHTGAVCVLVAPPNGAAKSEKRLDIVYRMISEAAAGRCKIYTDSRKFKACGKEDDPRCDGYHLGYTANDRAQARRWALEVSSFINN